MQNSSRRVRIVPVFIFFIFAAANAHSARAAEVSVTPESNLEKALKSVTAGDSIILQNGTWLDADLKFENLPGTPDAPIRIRAESPGSVILTGKTEFRISGQYVEVSGLVFRNMAGVSDVMQLRTHSQRLAHHCRVTDCAFEQTVESAEKAESHWLSVYGTHNRIDHCYFAGKTNAGTTFVVWVGDDPQHHQIDHNHFGPRPELGKNGGETLRIGTSEVSENESATIVEDNYFHSCDGESEIVSNKSCGNVYRHNVFDQCSGALTLRHGHRCTVNGNIFLGGKKRGTGGVRIIGQSHVVTNNYFEGLRGDAERAAVSMMNGYPDSPLNGYAPVKDAVVANNTFIDCKVSLEIGVGAGKKQSAAPQDCRITHNVFHAEKLPHMRTPGDPVRFHWNDNRQQVKQGYSEQDIRFDDADFQLTRAPDGLMRPGSLASLKTGSPSDVSQDIDGFPRGDASLAGCDDPQTPLRAPATMSSTGPSWRNRKTGAE